MAEPTRNQQQPTGQAGPRVADAPATYELRVWLPDRPGALADVAGRIGAVGGDVIGIEILETGGGSAIDDLTVVLPPGRSVDELVATISAAAGVAVEEVVHLDAPRADPSLATLSVAREVAVAPPSMRLQRFCTAVRDLIGGEWAVAVHLVDGREIAGTGRPPDVAWLIAFLLGSRHLTANDTTPGDIVWCYLPGRDVGVAAGRSGRVFHAREREQFRLLGEIVDAL